MENNTWKIEIPFLHQNMNHSMPRCAQVCYHLSAKASQSELANTQQGIREKYNEKNMSVCVCVCLLEWGIKTALRILIL